MPEPEGGPPLWRDIAEDLGIFISRDWHQTQDKAAIRTSEVLELSTGEKLISRKRPEVNIGTRSGNRGKERPGRHTRRHLSVAQRG